MYAVLELVHSAEDYLQQCRKKICGNFLVSQVVQNQTWHQKNPQV